MRHAASRSGGALFAATLVGIAPPPRPAQSPPRDRRQALTVGGVFAGDFRVVRLLAKGGMGLVFEVEQLSTGRRRALKVLSDADRLDEWVRRRFVREARASAIIGSEHVVEVAVAGSDEKTGTLWMAMELLPGQTLASRLASLPGRPLPAREAWAVLRQLLRGLAQAHARAVVHRDLKPSNLFLCDVPHSGVGFTVKLLDFGIACFLAPGESSGHPSGPLGTPLWMAPEQAGVERISPAADVWSVGLIAFRLFSGRHYWVAANDDEPDMAAVFEELLHAPLPSASERAEALGCTARLPMGFDGWFARCVARDPAHRFADAAEAAAALSLLAPPAVARVAPAAPLGETFHEAQTIRTRSLTSREASVVSIAPTPSAPPVALAVDTAPAIEVPLARPAPRTWYRAAVLGAIALGAMMAIVRSGDLVWGRARPAPSRAASAQTERPAEPAPAATPGAWAPGAQRAWRGVATGDDAGYSFVLVLRARDGDRVTGYFSWTVVRAAGARVGEQVRESVEGTYEPTLGALDLHGTRSTNALVYPVNAYRLRLAGEREVTGATNDASLALTGASAAQ